MEVYALFVFLMREATSNAQLELGEGRVGSQCLENEDQFGEDGRSGLVEVVGMAP